MTAGVRRRRSAAGARLPPTVSPVGVRRSVGAFASGGVTLVEVDRLLFLHLI